MNEDKPDSNREGWIGTPNPEKHLCDTYISRLIIEFEGATISEWTGGMSVAKDNCLSRQELWVVTFSFHSVLEVQMQREDLEGTHAAGLK